jgi:hypothetical protein
MRVAGVMGAWVSDAGRPPFYRLRMAFLPGLVQRKIAGDADADKIADGTGGSVTRSWALPCIARDRCGPGSGLESRRYRGRCNACLVDGNWHAIVRAFAPLSEAGCHPDDDVCVGRVVDQVVHFVGVFGEVV